MIETNGTVEDRETIETAGTNGVRNTTSARDQATPLDDRVLVTCRDCDHSEDRADSSSSSGAM